MKYVIVILLFSMITAGIVYGSSGYLDISNEIDVEENYPYINQMLLESSRYTQKEVEDAQVLDNYHDNFTLVYTLEELDSLGFELMFDTTELSVYFELDSFSMIVYNKVTNYFWSSRPEFQGASGTREDNTRNRNLMNSGLWIEYVRALNISSATIQTESIYSLADVSYANNGAVTEDEPDHLRPYYLEAGSYNYRRVTNAITNQTGSSFTVNVDVKYLDFNFDVVISLNQGSLEVYIPVEQIEESGDIYRLLGIQVFPYFGAAREDDFPGYIVIPDGVGALVRTNARHNTYFQARFYGTDIGYGTMTIPNLTVPVFGIVHETGANGYFVNVLEGSENAQLLANFWGDNTRYHRIGTRYNVRHIYRYIINKAGEGNETISDEMTTQDLRLSYQFLSDDEASYVGIAKGYRDHLIAEGVLTQREKVVEGNIPIQLDYLMSDHEPSFIGSTRVTMTTASQVLNAYEYFKSEGIHNQQLTLMGWSRDGFINRNPYRTNSWDKRGIENLSEHVIEDGNTIYLTNDYIVSSELSRRVIYNRDVARSLDRLKIVRNRRNLNGQVTEVYHLYPEQSLSMAKSDINFFNDLGVSGLSMHQLGSTLFSYYDQGNYGRSYGLEYYQEIASLYDQLVLSNSNVYMYQYIDGYSNMAITNSQYDYYTDLVPLIPIILKGSISYYTPNLNFNALAEDRFLTMVDFAINPSYMLTHENTYEMRYTASNIFYTTTLSDYEEEIVTAYHYVNDALKYVTDAYVIDREVIETGLVKVSYSNQVSIYVNYNYTSRNVDALTIAARSYEVILP
ncbi:MAG: DUF5696 domain-containing protein [Tenericutes bacterium]|nr:DUF5696 domain-containing protein [Mycoplasmatota bacterium]